MSNNKSKNIQKETEEFINSFINNTKKPRGYIWHLQQLKFAKIVIGDLYIVCGSRRLMKQQNIKQKESWNGKEQSRNLKNNLRDGMSCLWSQYLLTRKEHCIYWEMAQNNAIDMAVQYDNSFTKKCSEIIRTKAHFFCGLSNIQNVVVIGHSLSPVDWDYFVKIRDSFPNNKNVNVFRTDKISVKFYEKDDSEILKPIPKERYLAASEDQVWKVNTVEKLITILLFGNESLILTK